MSDEETTTANWAPRKSVGLPVEVYDELCELAASTHRTIGGCIAWMIEVTKRGMATPTPTGQDANPQPAPSVAR